MDFASHFLFFYKTNLFDIKPLWNWLSFFLENEIEFWQKIINCNFHKNDRKYLLKTKNLDICVSNKC